MLRQTVLPIKIEKTEKEITPYSGLLLFIEAYQAFGVEAAIKEVFPEPGSAKGFEANTYIISMLLVFLGGGKFIEDIRKVKLDRALRRLGKIETVPSGDAVGDWLRRDSLLKIKLVNKVQKKLIYRIMKKIERTEFTLDIDATGIEANKHSAKTTYKGYSGYMPMLGFLAEVDLCVGQEFREGNETPSSKNLEFIQQCERMIPAGKRITRFRSDSAAYQSAIFNDLEERGIRYTITGVKNSAMLKTIAAISEDKWQSFKNRDGIQTGREIAEAVHTMEATEKSFRIIVQRWEMNNEHEQLSLFEAKSGYYYHVVCTNYEREKKTSSEVVYWHNQRANSENYNKEIKGGFNLDYLPCDNFEANGVWFGVGLLAYNLFIGIKQVLMPQDWVKKTIATVRWQFIQIAGKIVKGQNQLKLKLSNISNNMLKLFEEVRTNCYQLMLSG